jgi:hypothetical protein
MSFGGQTRRSIVGIQEYSSTPGFTKDARQAFLDALAVTDMIPAVGAMVDLTLALFPASIFWKLHMKLKTKVSLSILMGLGVLYVVRHQASEDILRMCLVQALVRSRKQSN